MPRKKHGHRQAPEPARAAGSTQGEAAIAIFGASGDLTNRKVVPALFSLWQAGLLPKSTRIFGVGRTKLSDSDFRRSLHGGVSKFSRLKPDARRRWDSFARNLSYISGDYDDPGLYEKVRQALSEHSEAQRGSCLFYLATPPALFPVIAKRLGDAGLSKSDPAAWSRLIIEKPFGRSEETAKELNGQIRGHFREDQVYRIDHYLGKETVQNVLTLRFANAIFEPIWNRNYIDHVQITMAETVGVEHRAGYYESAGVVRDMAQNHLLQLVCLTAMEAPIDFDERALRDEKVKVLRSISPIAGADGVFGQYDGYREEKGVAKESRTPTFVAFKLFVDNWRWQGVPFYLRTGKRLAQKSTQISLKFKRVPRLLFRDDHDLSPNRISLCIQPDEGVHLQFETQVPGMQMKTTRAELEFHYNQFGESVLPEAYERLLLDAIHGDATLFSREDEVELAWRIVTPLIRATEGEPGTEDRSPLRTYEVGSWGPPEAETLIADDGRAWQPGCAAEKGLASRSMVKG